MGLDLLPWPGLERVDRHRHRPRIRDVDDRGTDRWTTTPPAGSQRDHGVRAELSSATVTLRHLHRSHLE